MNNKWKKAAAGLLAMALVVGAAPTNVGTGGLFGGTSLTAYAEGEPTVNVSPVNSGTVSIEGYTSSSGYPAYHLTANPAEGYRFVKWTYNVSGGSPTSQTYNPWNVMSTTLPYMSDITAVFEEIPSTYSVTGVTLNKETATMNVGGTETLTATVSPDNATDTTVTWSSDNTAVATVDENGNVTAVSAGTANITATATNGTEDTADDKTASCAVTVNAAVPTEQTLKDGKYVQTATQNGTFYTRYVFVKPKSEIEGKSKAVFTAKYNGTEKTSETSTYYTELTTGGIHYTPESEDSVIFAVTITGVPADKVDDLKCELSFEGDNATAPEYADKLVNCTGQYMPCVEEDDPENVQFKGKTITADEAIALAQYMKDQNNDGKECAVYYGLSGSFPMIKICFGKSDGTTGNGNYYYREEDLGISGYNVYYVENS